MKQVDAGFVRYNANSGQKNTGDCVARSISFATGQDYSTTLHQLQQLARNLNYPSYRNSRVFQAMMNTLGLKENKIADLGFTVADFCEDHPEGTYLLIVGKNPGQKTHAVCVNNGDAYDSWDSQQQFISSYWLVTQTGNTIQLSEKDIENLKDDLTPVLERVILQSSKKMPYSQISYNFVDSSTVDYGVRFTVFCSTAFEDPKMSLYSQPHRKYMVAKLNPLKPYNEQKQQVIEKARVQVREWLYSIRKEIEDALAWYEASKNRQRGFVGNTALLAKLPKDFQKYVNDIYNYGYSYGISFQDYYNDDINNYLNGVFETWNQLMKAVKDYIKYGIWDY